MDYITTLQIAQHWGYTASRARQLAMARRIPSEKVGGSRLFKRAYLKYFKPAATGRPAAKKGNK